MLGKGFTRSAQCRLRLFSFVLFEAMNKRIMPTQPLTFQTTLSSVNATLAFGAVLGARLNAAWRQQRPVRVLLLYGDLGCGKTTLTRGLAEALPGGELAEVSSPSFTVCNVYPTQPEIVHCDLYRSDKADGFADGLPEEAEEALDRADGSCVLVEWAQRLAPGDIPSERLDIHMKSCHEMHSVTLCAYGSAATRLLQELAVDMAAS